MRKIVYDRFASFERAILSGPGKVNESQQCVCVKVRVRDPKAGVWSEKSDRHVESLTPQLKEKWWRGVRGTVACRWWAAGSSLTGLTSFLLPSNYAIKAGAFVAQQLSLSACATC